MSGEVCPHRWLHGVMPCERCGNNESQEADDAVRAQLDDWRNFGFAHVGPPITCDRDMIDGLDKQLRDLCAQLASAQAELAERKWIPVGERMPEEGALVLFWHCDWPTDNNIIGLGRFRRDDDGGDWWEDVSEQDMSGDSTIYYSGVTHWMPLPSPPKGGQ